jgi:hypothetical protein
MMERLGVNLVGYRVEGMSGFGDEAGKMWVKRCGGWTWTL